MRRDLSHIVPSLSRGDRPRKNKFGATPTEVDGIRFDSKAEARRWTELRLLERAGQISELTRQPPFDLCFQHASRGTVSVMTECGRVMRYVADFAYREGGGMVYEDVKGKDTPVSAIKRAIVLAFYGVAVRVVK